MEWRTPLLVDLPGDNNFLGDLDLILKAVDGVVFVIDAIDGVRPLGRKLWRAICDANLPPLFM
jgi:translation elongation factor 2 (EF-2/EF-G)